jgi:hypothetical protein
LLRLLHDVAVTVETSLLRDLMVERGERIVAGCRSRLPPEDLVRLEQRFAELLRVGGAGQDVAIYGVGVSQVSLDI